MGQLRTAVRAYAVEGHGPAALLERLDRLAGMVSSLQLTTCVYGVYDPADRSLLLASAGHLPPVLVGPGGADLLVLEPGLPLGVGAAAGGCAEALLTLPAGTSVLLYTDGLVEGRTRSLDEGLALLRDAAAGVTGDPAALCDQVLAALGRDYSHDDDIALLALTTDPAGSAQVAPRACMDLPARAESSRLGRDFAVVALGRWQLPDETVERAALVVSELVTNAVRHAGTDVRLQLEVALGELRVSVADGHPGLPAIGGAEDGTAEGGRGLRLVEAYSGAWGVEPTAGGKVVWARLPVEAGSARA
jgi:anti-sigma regulatory factor (Ser/Thr protein kinase)